MAEKEKKAQAADKEKTRYRPKTAADVVGVHADKVAADREKRAADAGVKDASDIDYAEALDNYESRSDIEPLARRRAREVGVSFSDTDFRRDADFVDEGLHTVASTKPEQGGADSDKPADNKPAK